MTDGARVPGPPGPPGPPEPRLGAPRTLDAPAKVNLLLRVLGRRDDGYHELVTVMQTLDLRDRVVVTLRERGPAAPGTDVRMEVTGEERAGCPADADNLAARAASAALEHLGLARDVGADVALTKRIPAGGGLGGGSSDAAAVLRAVDDLTGGTLGDATLVALAARLGSDVPFFVHGGTALCTGRGEHVRPIRRRAPLPDVTLVLPPFGVSTRKVYAALRARPMLGTSGTGDLDAICERFERADAREVESLFRNDLERAAVEVEPRLGAYLSRPDVHLSGSGSTCFTFATDVTAFADRGARLVTVGAYDP